MPEWKKEWSGSDWQSVWKDGAWTFTVVRDMDRVRWGWSARRRAVYHPPRRLSKEELSLAYTTPAKHYGGWASSEEEAEAMAMAAADESKE